MRSYIFNQILPNGQTATPTVIDVGSGSTADELGIGGEGGMPHIYQQ